jgi:hypothetical protein
VSCFDHVAGHPLHGLALLIEQSGKFLGVPVDAERELRQIVAADREPTRARKERYAARCLHSGASSVQRATARCDIERDTRLRGSADRGL